MILEWYHWAILGVVLIVAELLVPAFVLVWFGLGALIVAGLVALFPAIGLIAELLIWIVSSSLLVFLWFKLFKPLQHKTLAGRSQAQAVGEVGLMVTNVAPFQKGQIRFQAPLIGSDVWECIADEEIKAGERAKVISIEGSIVKVITAK
jgi:membrane protein implicated in regulation of membrane protease activity